LWRVGEEMVKATIFFDLGAIKLVRRIGGKLLFKCNIPGSEVGEQWRSHYSIDLVVA
jgi:hypothetical protein